MNKLVVSHIRRRRLRLLALFALLQIAASALPPVCPQARAETDAVVPRKDLLGLARQFVEKVGAGFDRADEYILTPEEKRRRRYAVDIPDGELLLLRVGVVKSNARSNRQRLLFEEPVIAIKQGDDVMVSLSDFFNVAQFAVEVKPAEKVAEGWFIRKNKIFRLDVGAMTANVDGAEYRLTEGDVGIDDTDIYLKGKILEEMFDFESEVVLATQFMDVKTEQKWPSIEKLERARRRGRFYLPPPSLPRQDEPYDLASVPNAYIKTTRSFQRSAEGQISKSASYSAIIEGDMIGHTGRILTGGSLDPGGQRIDSVQAAFRKESDKADLLGRMKAREYEFGDIGGGVGLRVTNRDPYVTSDPTTAIEGDITPGWDAELYRGGEYLQNLTDIQGRYRFEDVRLTGGANDFRILKYGPLGEVEEESVTIYSTPKLAGTDGGLYDVKATAAATNLWTRTPQESQDKYTPIVDGSYQWALDQNTSMKATLSTSQQQGEQKTFVGLGAASYFDKTLLNTNVTADVDGPLSASVTARRSILDQSVTLGGEYTEEDFGSISDASTPSQYSLSAAARGRLPYLPVTYTASADYTENEDGNSRQKNSLTLGGRPGRIGVSTGLTETINKSEDSQSTALDGFTALNGRLERVHWRASADYGIKPEGFNINTYNLNMTRGLTKNVSGNLTLQNKPDTDFTSAIASVSWNAKYMRVSPRVSYDSDNNLGVFLNTDFGLAYSPYAPDIVMRGKDISKLGGVSAFVFLDRDGNGIFSEGDEPIQDAIVEAVHSRSAGTTDENGEAFLFDLPATIITDVRLDENSFFDPFLVPGREGVSILPRPGHEARIEFPVHNGGELDGTVYARFDQGKPRAVRNVRVLLYDMDGKLAKSVTTSFDGFYLLQKIHPGRYYLMIDERDARNFGFIRPLPEQVSFGYEGTLVYGHDITLGRAEKDGPADVPLSIGADYGEYVSMNPAFDPDFFEGRTIALNLGSYHSNFLMSVVWYRLKSRYDAILGGGWPLVTPSESFASAETGLHTLRVQAPRFDIEDAWRRCRAFMARGIYCGVEVLPGGFKRQAATGKEGGRG
ncbi:MAG: hypothetical protein HY370_05705 [Proteobacteria bacterium]|nr:hypothetical protein [Pseudomonadota bacterium]